MPFSITGDNATPILAGGIIIPAAMEVGNWLAKIPRIPAIVKPMITPAILGAISAIISDGTYAVLYPLSVASAVIGTFKVVKPLSNWLTGKNERRRIVKLKRLRTVLKAKKGDFLQERPDETTATNDSN